ncbi:MAG: insulinase family protein, partial [Cyanobacteria bacterium J06576_12]
QDVSSSFSLQADCSVLSLSMWLAVEDVETVERVVCDRIYQLSQACVSHTELARAKRLLLTDYAFSTETPGQIAGLYGYYATIADPSLAISYPQQIQATTASSLQQIAQAHLNAERYTAVVINPD